MTYGWLAAPGDMGRALLGHGGPPGSFAAQQKRNHSTTEEKVQYVLLTSHDLLQCGTGSNRQVQVRNHVGACCHDLFQGKTGRIICGGILDVDLVADECSFMMWMLDFIDRDAIIHEVFDSTHQVAI